MLATLVNEFCSNLSRRPPPPPRRSSLLGPPPPPLRPSSRRVLPDDISTRILEPATRLKVYSLLIAFIGKLLSIVLLTFHLKHELRLLHRGYLQIQQMQSLEDYELMIDNISGQYQNIKIVNDFLPTQTFLNDPYLLKAVSISFFEQEDPRLPT